MSIEIKPCADLDEFWHAFQGIGQYFGAERNPERLERFLEYLPLERMLAAREDGTTVGGAGSFPFELTIPGGTAPCAGGLRRRRLPVAPQARRAAGDDALPAR